MTRHFILSYYSTLGFPGGSTIKESTCQAGDAGSVPGEINGNHFTMLAWEIPWTEELGGLPSMGLQNIQK